MNRLGITFFLQLLLLISLVFNLAHFMVSVSLYGFHCLTSLSGAQCWVTVTIEFVFHVFKSHSENSTQQFGFNACGFTDFSSCW